MIDAFEWIKNFFSTTATPFTSLFSTYNFVGDILLSLTVFIASFIIVKFFINIIKML